MKYAPPKDLVHAPIYMQLPFGPVPRWGGPYGCPLVFAIARRCRSDRATSDGAALLDFGGFLQQGVFPPAVHLSGDSGSNRSSVSCRTFGQIGKRFSPWFALEFPCHCDVDFC